MQYWFCLIHQKVEVDAGCPNESRLGPYESIAAASDALRRMSDRNKAVDEDD
jgi:hypothetical protein